MISSGTRLDPSLLVANPDGSTRLVARLSAHTVGMLTGVASARLLYSRDRTGPTALARHIAMYVTCVGLGNCATRTAPCFGRDRTTVSHACARIEELRDQPDIDRALDLIERAVRHFLDRATDLTSPV